MGKKTFFSPPLLSRAPAARAGRHRQSAGNPRQSRGTAGAPKGAPGTPTKVAGHGHKPRALGISAAKRVLPPWGRRVQFRDWMAVGRGGDTTCPPAGLRYSPSPSREGRRGGRDARSSRRREPVGIGGSKVVFVVRARARERESVCVGTRAHLSPPACMPPLFLPPRPRSPVHRECSSNGRAVASHATGTGIDALHFHFGGAGPLRRREKRSACVCVGDRESLRSLTPLPPPRVCVARKTAADALCVSAAPPTGVNASSWFPPKFPPG